MVVVVVDLLLLLLFRIYMYGLGKSLWVFFLFVWFFHSPFLFKGPTGGGKGKKGVNAKRTAYF